MVHVDVYYLYVPSVQVPFIFQNVFDILNRNLPIIGQLLVIRRMPLLILNTDFARSTKKAIYI